MSRGAMRHRAAVERNTAVGNDSWNRPSAPNFTPLATLPCRAWSRTKKHVRDDGKEAVIEDIRALFTADADVQTGDRISTITDRRGNTIFDGPLAVQTLTGRGANVRHREVMLTRHV